MSAPARTPGTAVAKASVTGSGTKPDTDLGTDPGTARPMKRSFTIRGHRTSISLEAAFWSALREAAQRETLPLAELVSRIDEARGDTNLSSAVRVWVLAYWRQATAVDPTA